MKIKYFVFIIFIYAISFVMPLGFSQIEISESLSSVSSDKISLDLKGMDIVEVLKTLASKGNMNLVVGNNVRGRVTMFLKDVDVKDAFEIILLANELASDTRGGIIYVMTEKDYQELYGRKYSDKKEAKIIQLRYAKAVPVGKALDQIKTRIGKVIVDEGSNTVILIDTPEAISQAQELVNKIDKPTTTEIFELYYAKAADIKEKITTILTTGVGTIEVDERTNKVVITDLEHKMDNIRKVVRAFDSKLQQVLIEAKIVEVTLNDEYKLGVDWETVTKELNRILKTQLSIKSDFKLASTGTLIPGAEILVGSFGVTSYTVMIQALKKVGDANVLSSPRITVMNNEEAKILVGSSEPYATNTVTQGTSTTTTATQLTFLDIGVKLFVTPTINKDGFVTMKIRPEVSSTTRTYTYGSPSTTVPIVDTTQAETSVMVKDGVTIVIAGLIKDERSSTDNRIPFLGDLPVVGAAFKRVEDSVKKKELVIFLTPHIVSGDADYVVSPRSYPIGEEEFTMPEGPALDKRSPREMGGSIFKERKHSKVTLDGTADLRTAKPEEYFYAIKNKIVKNISLPKKKHKLISRGDRVTVSFVLNSGGNIISSPLAKESTNEYLTEAVIKAVEKSAPFPPFPPSIREFKKEFTLDINYESE